MPSVPRRRRLRRILGHGRLGGLPRPPGASDRRRARVFTGIVEDLGEVEAIDHQGDFARIYIRSSVVTSDARPGDSICVSGVCLTVTGVYFPGAAGDAGAAGAPGGFTADVMGETLR